MVENKFQDLFNVKKPILGMIHLAGDSLTEKINRAIEELEIYQNEGINGAIVEDYHASSVDLAEALKEISKRKWDIKIGVNCLSDPNSSFLLAQKYRGSFVQVDSVLGYRDQYYLERLDFPNIAVLGGVRFKYQPDSCKTLEEDIAEGRSRCDAIVTTGKGTGIETPIQKLIDFKKYMGDFPLIVGAGVTPSNVYDQLRIADSAIVGSSFKPKGNTFPPVDETNVRNLISKVYSLRN